MTQPLILTTTVADIKQLVSQDGTTVPAIPQPAGAATTVTLSGPDVTGSGPAAAVPTDFAIAVTTVPGAATANLARQRINFVALMGPDCTLGFPAAPLTGDMVFISFQFTGNVGAPPTTLNDQGSGIPIEIPLQRGVSTNPVLIADSAELLCYQFDGTGENLWMLIASNQALTNFKGPISPPDNGWWAVTAIFIDELNTSGLASDTNSGVTAGAPLLTKTECFRRYGTLRPLINHAVTCTFLSLAAASAQVNDPWLLEPILGESGVYNVTANFAGFTAAFTGTLNVVTPKATATTPGNSLESTFNTTSGVLSPGMLLVNATRGNSLAFLGPIITGTTYQISQPVNPWTLGTELPLTANQNNAWASGDAITAYTLPNLDIAVAGADQFGIDSGITAGMYFVYFNVIGTSAVFGFDPMRIKANCNFVHCLVEKAFHTDAQGTAQASSSAASLQQPRFYNCEISNNGAAGSFQVQAGLLESNGFDGPITLQDDVIVFPGTVGQGEAMISRLIWGRVCIDLPSEGSTLHVQIAEPHPSQSPIVYGPGTLDANGPVNYGTSTATNAFRASITLVGQSTGYSLSTSAGVTTVHGGIALSGPNIDAAAGAAGFGGTATNLAGASFTNGTQS